MANILTRALNVIRQPYRAKMARRHDPTLGYYIHPDGRATAIKASSGAIFPSYASAANGIIDYTTQGLANAYALSVWVYRCVNLRAQTINGLPWGVFQKGTEDKVDDHAFARMVKEIGAFFFLWEFSLCVWGEVFFEKAAATNAYYDAHYQKSLYWLNNMGMQVNEANGRITDFWYNPVQGGKVENFERDEIAFFKYLNPFDNLRGLSPLVSVLDEATTDSLISLYTKSYYQNDARPGIIITPKEPMAEPDLDRFEATWKLNFQGPRKAGKPGFLSHPADITEIQRSPTLEDTELADNVRRKIAAAYGVPLSMAGAWDATTYQSLPEQRKDFAENTVMPEADRIAADVNRSLMPWFDASGNYEFKFIYKDLLPLAEDAQRRDETARARLASGGITLNEYRETIEQPPITTGNVFFIPSTSVTTKPEQLGVPPAPSQPANPFGGFNFPPRQPEPQAPPTVTQGANGNGNSANTPVATTTAANVNGNGHIDPSKELAAWQKKALNKGVVKALSFKCDVLSEAVQDAVREGLATLGNTAGTAEIKAVFVRGKQVLEDPETPPEYMDYWRRYDDLQKAIGYSWLAGYMEKAYNRLPVQENLSGAIVADTLRALHDDLQAEWVGTEETPGVLTQLVLAGMAAANEVVSADRAGNPHRAPGKADGLSIDWQLLSREAIEFARQYFFDLIRGIDETTAVQVSEAVQFWIASGEPLDELKKALEGIFKDEKRAAAIAESESSRAYAEGSLQRYRGLEIEEIKLSKMNDGRVCEVCKPLEGTVVPINVGWNSSTGKRYPPFHTRCRHWIIGVV